MTEAVGPDPIWRNPYLWAVLAGLIFIPAIRPLLRFEPDPPQVIGQLPPYTLTDTTGASFGSADLADGVYVANFIFTRCVSICPRLTLAMSHLAQRYDEAEISGVHLVSISVDPDYDTPERLREYGEVYGVDPARWTLLTGPIDRIHELVQGGFKTALGDLEPLGENLVEIAHTGKFVLVDGNGGIRGYYDSDEMGLDEIFHRSQHVLKQLRR